MPNLYTKKLYDHVARNSQEVHRQKRTPKKTNCPLRSRFALVVLVWPLQYSNSTEKCMVRMTNLETVDKKSVKFHPVLLIQKFVLQVFQICLNVALYLAKTEEIICVCATFVGHAA